MTLMAWLRRKLGKPADRDKKIDKLEARTEDIETRHAEALDNAKKTTDKWWTEVRHADRVLVGGSQPARPQKRPKQYSGGEHA